MPSPDRIETGRVYRLKIATLGSMLDARHRPVAVTIPQGAVLSVADASSGDHMVEVLWDGQTVRVFAIDLRERGELASSARAGS
jgi:hypothetical protein